MNWHSNVTKRHNGRTRRGQKYSPDTYVDNNSVSGTLPGPVGTSYIFKIKKYMFLHIFVCYLIYAYKFNYNSLHFLIIYVALQGLHILYSFFTTNLHDTGHSFNFQIEDTEV